ncbi:MAG: TonB-dependent receptor [Terriglobales bacterium]
MRSWMALGLLLALPFTGFAQQYAAGTISGVVSDPQAAVVSGAEVEVTATATNQKRTATTDGQGRFVVPGLQPGSYQVAVKATGFQPKQVPVSLRVGQQVLLRISVEVGQATEVIEIDDRELAYRPRIETSVVDGVVGSAQIEHLPLNGRNYMELALLTPGNSLAPNFDPTKTNTVVISSAGQQGRGGNITIDGADNNDDVVGGPLLNLPQDAVAEFQVATNRFSASLGRSASSVINVVTKAGTNTWHGSASVFLRDKRLQGLPATFDRSLEALPFDRQQYAASLGGPLKQDKVWWFTAFEYRNQDGAVLVGERDIVAQEIIRTFAPAPLDDLLFNTRGDWQISGRDRAFFRYSLERADDVAQSTLNRALGSASQRQQADNRFQTFASEWMHIFSARLFNRLSFSINNFFNRAEPVTPGPQLTFPSIQDGASFRVPQQTRQNRLQFADTLNWVTGRHSLSFGEEVQRIDSDLNLEVFQSGRIELVEDFASADRDNDGVTNDDDLLFAVTLRSAFPDRPLVLPDTDSTHLAFFIQDDIRVNSHFSLNLGLRYEVDTDVKNLSRVNELNPLILPFLQGNRTRDTNNLAPRVGFNWSPGAGKFSLHGGYGIYYDRVTLEIQTLERGLDGRALPIEVRAGSLFFTDLFGTGLFFPGAPTISNPFTGFILPGAGAGGINIIDNDLQNPMVQQFNLGIEWGPVRNLLIRADGIHNLGTHFIIGRQATGISSAFPDGIVCNPVLSPFPVPPCLVEGAPDVVKNLESSVNTKYDGLLVSVEKRFSRGQFRASYTLSKAFNYANDDQIPFSNGPIDPNDLQREYGPPPNDQRQRFVFSGVFDLPHGFRVSPIWTMASGVPMDILLPDASSRVPQLGRNAGGRQFHTGAELNDFITANALGLPLAPADAQFSDSFHSFDLRLSKTFKIGEQVRIEGMGEVFNLFNVTNILGVSNTNYSGFGNVLGSGDFGRPVTTAGGVFGSGGPRAFQLGARVTF